MAATGFTPISLYYSATTTNVPLAANLVAGELALNTVDGKLFYKDSSNVVQVLATKGGVGSSTNTQVLYNSSGLTVGSANLTFNGTVLTSTFAGPLNGTVGASTPNTGAFTTLSYTGTLTSGTGVVNIGSGQVYKDASGNVGIGTSSFSLTNAGRGLLEINGSTDSIIGFKYANSVAGYIQANSSAFNINSASTQPLYFTAGGTTQPVVFQTNNTERMRIDSSGNVGIGTSSPQGKLEVVGGYTTLGNFNAGVSGTSPTNGGISFSSNISNGSAEGNIWNGNDPAIYVNTGILFTQRLTASTRRDLMFLHNNGNVGIGTRSTYGSAKLTLIPTTNPTAGLSSNSQIKIGESSNNPAYCLNVGYGLIGGDYKGYIQSQNNSLANDLLLNPDGGNLLVGTTVQPSASQAGIRAGSGGFIEVSCGAVTTFFANMSFANGNGYVGSISTSGSATTYNTISDYRLKEAIAPMTGALDKVALLKPVTYKWKVDGSDGQGFIAHELAEVCPHAVTGEKDAVDADGNPQYQGIDTSFLVATLTAALQEQQALITTLTARLDAANL